KETSGVMVIAKTDDAHRKVSKQFKDHSIDRKYLALVYGKVKKPGKINLAIGRDRIHRKKISARTSSPREAETHYIIKERFKNATLLEVSPQTGRTHPPDPRPHDPHRPPHYRRQNIRWENRQIIRIKRRAPHAACRDAGFYTSAQQGKTTLYNTAATGHGSSFRKAPLERRKMKLFVFFFLQKQEGFLINARSWADGDNIEHFIRDNSVDNSKATDTKTSQTD
ncbi:MAG: RNA pseudouridine synthase, partial [Nitrospirae bacterium]|nr:RNA pseudouridine synthase [Candidatus Manganitrophaceae bacterium]